ncbi:MAG: transcriptional regulator [Candidatus Bathyarchaeia archaeon]
MNDKALGGALLGGGILGFIGYVLLLIFNTILALQIIAIIAVGAIAFILAWIGYTLITTPAPAPIESETAPETTSTTSPASAPEQK